MGNFYTVTSETQWIGSPGDPLLVIANFSENKKVKVHSISISTNNRKGLCASSDTQTPLASRVKLSPVSGIKGGEFVKLIPLDTNNSQLTENDIKVKKNSSFFPIYDDITTHTDSIVAQGDTTFTPDTSPNWIANEHVYAGRRLKVSTGGNSDGGNPKYYDITANTTTSLTITPPFQAAEATTGTLVEERCFSELPVLKIGSTSTSFYGLSVMNAGELNSTSMCGGDLLYPITNEDHDEITIRPGESVAVIATSLTTNMPLIVEGILKISGNKTGSYCFSFYTNLLTEYESILSIENPSNSNNVIKIQRITVSELGTFDTPYIQITKVAGLTGSVAFNENRYLKTTKLDTSSPDLSASGVWITQNTPISPYNIPATAIADGSSGTPKTLNYLHTKDFVGPSYIAVFPEVYPLRMPNASTASPNVPCGISGASHYFTSAINPETQITINPREALALVITAETAVNITTAIGIGAYTSLDINVVLEVDVYKYTKLTLTGIKTGSEVRIYEHGTTNELAGIESSSTSFSWEYEFKTPPVTADIVIHHTDWQYYRIENVVLTQTDISIPIQQIKDRQYFNP